MIMLPWRQQQLLSLMEGSNCSPKSRSCLDDDAVSVETGNSVSLESNASSSDLQKSTEESSYDLLLKQQQMFLQWQLENELEKV